MGTTNPELESLNSLNQSAEQTSHPPGKPQTPNIAYPNAT